MIHSVTANQPSFRPVFFKPGFNVILADRKLESTRKDSRNGLGKSTLIEIIHFCLGGSAPKRKGLRVDALVDWSFTVELDAGPRRLSITRAVAKPTEFVLTGDVVGLQPDAAGVACLKQKELNSLLGTEMLGLGQPDARWAPSFRSVISYFVRRGKDAYLTPFRHTRMQHSWDEQVHNSLLLGLHWESAQARQLLREKAKALNAVKAAAKTGLLEGMVGNVGELEADRVRLVEEATESRERLDSFQVHEDYHAIEQEASRLTEQIHLLSNSNVVDRRRLIQAREAASTESRGGASAVQQLYEAAGVQLGEMVVERLEAVQEFHRQVTANRTDFLAHQIQAISDAIQSRSVQIASLSGERAGLMKVLSEHGALEEYTALQQMHLSLLSELTRIEDAIVNLKRIETGTSQLKIEKERLYQEARLEHEQRAAVREKAIRLFNSNSQALYESPGRLIINVGPDGPKFEVEIERASSDGVGSMQIFCYDLTIAEIWAGKTPSPRFLIHDSRLFDGVDERQVGRALSQAAKVSARAGFQYICTLNSDQPMDDFADGFDLEEHVVLRLTDGQVEGSLLGVRF